MKRFSPTSLSMLDRCCPAALKFYLDDRSGSKLKDKDGAWDVEGPELAEIGIVFHDCVHHAALARADGKGAAPAMEAAAAAMAGHIAPERVLEGYELAQDFVTWWEFPEGFDFEQGFAFDAKWRKVDWESPDGKFRMIADAIGVVEDDHPYFGLVRIACGMDYKSGWGVRKEELESLQMDAYIKILRKMYGEDIDGIRLEIISPRFRTSYVKSYFFEDEDDMAEIRRREKRLAMYIAAAENSQGIPRIGYGCSRCHYTARCEAFTKRVADLQVEMPDLDRAFSDVARDYVVLQARVKEVESFLRESAKDKPINMDDQVLGFHPKESREIDDPGEILKMWFDSAEIELSPEVDSALKGLMAAAPMSVTAAEKVVKKLAKDLGYRTQKDALADLMPKLAHAKTTMKWGWQKKQEQEST